MAQQRYALLIGANGPVIDGQQLRFAERDAALLANVLKDGPCRFSEVQSLIASDRAVVLDTLNTYVSICSEDDVFFVHFAGHGIFDENLYLVANTTDINNKVSSAIDISDVKKYLRRCKARYKILVLDCCHASAVLPDTFRSLQQLNNILSESLGRGEIIIAACSYRAKARELADLDGGSGFLSYAIRSACSDQFSKASSNKQTLSIQEVWNWILLERQRLNGSLILKDQQPLPEPYFHNTLVGIPDSSILLTDLPQESPREESINTPIFDFAQTIKDYLGWVIWMNRVLKLPGIGTVSSVPLEKVYVALKGDKASDHELGQARELLDREILEKLHEMKGIISEEELIEQRLKILQNKPFSPSLRLRGRSGQQSAQFAEVVSLAQAFQKERRLIILGDPGSGKTTLVRWLALKLALALKEHVYNWGTDYSKPLPRVSVPVSQVDPDVFASDEPIDIGVARLPILLHVADYAMERAKTPKKAGKALSLIDYLGSQPWLGAKPVRNPGSPIPDYISETSLQTVMWEYLKQEQAVVILDGLDELTEDRADVVREIQDFVATINGQGEPVLHGGNQVVITSRIAGYYALPIRGENLAHVTIESMKRPAVEQFCRAMITAISERKDQNNEEDLAQAQGLIDAIYDDQNWRIRELASNPLLITILSLVYRNNQGMLPQRRAVLYDVAMKTLIERSWQTTNLMNSIGINGLIEVLANVAAYIHQEYPTGLIRESDLREKIIQCVSPLLQNSLIDSRFREYIDSFIVALNKDVGLLAARGDRLYGFLHLTFQEYLAAIHFVKDHDQAHNEILQRLDAPRWREPILLALGYVGMNRDWSSRAREHLLRSLLNATDPLERFLPRTVLLVARTLPEIDMIDTVILDDVIGRLLAVYSRKRQLEDYSAIRDQIEDAFAKLRIFNQRAVDAALVKYVQADPALTPVVAQLAYKRDWLTRDIIEILQRFVAYDSTEWEWIVNRVLQDLVTPPPTRGELIEPLPPESPNVLYHKVRKLQEELRKLDKGETLNELKLEIASIHGQIAVRDASKIVLPENGSIPLYQRLENLQQQLKDIETARTRFQMLENIDTAENEYETYQIKYRRLSADYAIAYAAYTEEKKKRQQGARAPLSLDHLKFRSALKRGGPHLVDRIKSNPVWLRLITALYGGFGDYQSVFWSTEYRELANLLAQNEITREYLITQKREYYVGKWGYKETVLNIAMYLDAKQNGNSQRAKQALEFHIDYIYRDSPLNLYLLDGLRQDLSITSLTKTFWEIWHTHSEVAEKRIEALVALAIIGENILQALSKGLEDESYRALVQKVLLRLEQIAISLEDAVVRGKDDILNEIADIRFSGQDWIDFVQTIVKTLIVNTKQPVNIQKLASNAPTEAHPILEADRWFFTTVSMMDADVQNENDRVYNFAVILDTMKKKGAAALYTRAILSAWRAPNVAAAPLINLSQTWQVDPLAPESTDPNDISIDVLDGLENFHAMDDLRSSFGPAFRIYILMNFHEHIQRIPDLLPEILIFCLPYLNEERQFIAKLDSDILLVREPRRYIYNKIVQLRQPYYRARALLRLIPYAIAHTDLDQLLSELRSAYDKIEDAHQKVIIMERLMQHYEPQSQAELFDELFVNICLIQHQENRVRALIRSTRLAPVDRQSAIFAMAIQTTPAIKSESTQAELLYLIGQKASSYPEVIKLLQNRAEQLSTSWLQAKALGFLGTHLLRTTDQWEHNPQKQALWTPLLVSTSLREICDYFINISSLELLWVQFRENPSEEILFTLLDQGAQSGLMLTHTAVRAIDAMIGRGDVHLLDNLLPLLHSPSTSDTGVIETWLRCPYAKIADHAALFIAEVGRQFTLRYIPHLLALLNGNIDRSRDRVHIMIVNGVHYVADRDRTLHVSTMGPEALEMLVSDDLRRNEEGWKNPLSAGYIVIDVIHDSSEQLQSWIAHYKEYPDKKSVIGIILKNIEALTDATLTVFIAGLTSNNLPVQTVLLESLCKLSITQSNDTEMWQRLLPVLRVLPGEALDTISILPNRYMAVVEAARVALQEKESEDLIEHAERILPKYEMKLSHIIHLDDGTLGSRLKDFGDTFYVPVGGIDPDIIKAADAVGQDHELFDMLTLWMQRSLQELLDNELDDTNRKQTALLCVVAEVAKRMPATFAILAEPVSFEPLLLHAACYANSWYGRRAAIELLGLLRFVTGRIVQVINYALRDHHLVKLAVFEFIDNLQNLSHEVAAELIEKLCDEKMLYHESASVAYAVASILSLIGRNDHINQEQRRTIQSALVAAIDDPRSRRGVYHMVGLASVDERLKTTLLCKLNEGIFRAALETSGIL